MKPSRLPPGQQLAAPAKWPIVGEREPAPGYTAPGIRIHGAVERPRHWSLEELRALPQVSRTIDVHCVTRWSLLDATFRGVPLNLLLRETVPTAAARFLSFLAHSSRHHSTSLPLSEAIDLDVLIAFEFQGKPLEVEHGGPIRAVTPGRYFYKSVKWLSEIEVLTAERLGFWEATAGYHNHADPWKQERFVVSGLTRGEAGRILASRDISGRDLLGLDGSERDLPGLNGRGALLRNANFRNARLQSACFDGANLSNAHFEGADLRGASFRLADLEGASFAGSDLRAADLTGASLFGATFMEAPTDDPLQPTRAAVLDKSTQIDHAAFDILTPLQAEYCQRELRRSPTESP